ncbi:hypothetical protein TNCV_4217881 [Trichonephila clavipes]|nr:hypothetical protein TNCV_4217881 [Trichonephila clavipes]
MPKEIRTDIGICPNIEWYCQCKVSARIVGCYAHVTSVLGILAPYPTQTKTSSLGYADTLQVSTTGWSSDDSASEREKEI